MQELIRKAMKDIGHASDTRFPQRCKWLKLATDAVDRAGDVLVLSGMDSTNFMKNPQFLWQHGKSGAEINTIGRILKLSVAELGPGKHVLFGYAQYAPATNQLAESVYQMDSEGLLPANSIGFRPIEWVPNDYGGLTFTKWELIECSKVELPMNPEAVDDGISEVPGRYDEEPSGAKLPMTLIGIDPAVDWMLNTPLNPPEYGGNKRTTVPPSTGE